MQLKQSKPFRLISFFALLAVALLLLQPLRAAAIPLTAQDHLQQAWRTANRIGQYRYQTDVLQTTRPTVRLENVGRSAQTKRLAVTGEMDRLAETMSLRIAQGVAGRGPVMEMKIEAGRAYGRQDATAAWAPLEESVADLFAPGGDPRLSLRGDGCTRPGRGGGESLCHSPTARGCAGHALSLYVR